MLKFIILCISFLIVFYNSCFCSEVLVKAHFGDKGNEIFQEKSKTMPYLICEEMNKGASFQELLTMAVNERYSIAESANTCYKDQFKQHRFDREYILKCKASSTPISGLYPLMKGNLLKNLASLQKTETLMDLDENFSYRFREHTVSEWFHIIHKEHNASNQLNTYIMSFILGSKEISHPATLYIHEKKVSEDGSEKLEEKASTHYCDILKDAYEQAKIGINVPNVIIGNIDLEIKNTGLKTRSFLYIKDKNIETDYWYPFLLQHPPASSGNYHLSHTHKLFEEARHCKQDVETIVEKINTFSYWFSLTMPICRGSSSVNEWFIKSLYLQHDLCLTHQNNIVKMDELAQSSFTVNQFLSSLKEFGLDQTSPLTFGMSDYLATTDKKLSLMEFLNLTPVVSYSEYPANLGDMKDIIKTILVVSPYEMTGDEFEPLSAFSAKAREAGFESYMVWWHGNSCLSTLNCVNGKKYLEYNPGKDLSPKRYVDTYNVKQLDRTLVLDNSVLVVIPDTLTNAEGFFKPANRGIYWLSLFNPSNNPLNFIFQHLIEKEKLSHVECYHIAKNQEIQNQIKQWGLESTLQHESLSNEYKKEFNLATTGTGAGTETGTVLNPKASIQSNSAVTLLENPKYYLTMAAVFRDEAAFLKEWIEFHRLMGVEHFYLFNHMSQDNYMDVLMPYIDAGIVDLETNETNPESWANWNTIQCGLYTGLCKKVKNETEWLIIGDTDEFLFPVQENNENLPVVLKNYDSYAALSVNWQMFGNDNVEDLAPSELMIERLVKSSTLAETDLHVKTIVKPRFIKYYMNPHYPILNAPYHQINEKYERFFGPFLPKPSRDNLRINHYWGRTWKFFREVKQKRVHVAEEQRDQEARIRSYCEKDDLSIQRFVPALKKKMNQPNAVTIANECTTPEATDFSMDNK